jgi:hypothetical protein
MMLTANASRCAGDEVCLRVHRFQPTLPLAPPFLENLVNPCVKGDAGTTCIPQIHIIGGWHTFVDEALVPLLQAHPKLTLRPGGSSSCFNGWGDEPQAWKRWFGGWRLKPQSEKRLVQQCGHMLQFYPDFQNGYLREFLKAYWPCKAREVAKLRAAGQDEGAYYTTSMWATCRPTALAGIPPRISPMPNGTPATPQPHPSRTSVLCDVPSVRPSTQHMTPQWARAGWGTR